MFDHDDEESTSPQVVQDIIASLDAEEESQTAGPAGAAAGQIDGSASVLAGDSSAGEDVAHRKQNKETEKQTVGGVRNGVATNLNGKPKILNESTHSEGSSREDVVNGNVTESGMLVQSIASKFVNGSLAGKGVKSNGQGATKRERAGDGASTSPSSSDGVNIRVDSSTGEATGVGKETNGTRNGWCERSESHAEEGPNLGKNLNTPNASNGETVLRSPVAPAFMVDGSAQPPSASDEERQKSHSKGITSYAQLLDVAKMPKATAKGLLPAVPRNSSETSKVHPCGGAKPASTKRVAKLSPSLKLNIPSHSHKSGTSHEMPVPKVQHTILNITNPTSAQIPNGKYDQVLGVSGQMNNPYDAYKVAAKSHPELKRCHVESSVPAKRAKVREESMGGTTPLDLSNPSKKTVAADSTSMLSSSPVASPKPGLQKQKSGKSHDIHSIVDNLANREHISLTAISSKISSQPKLHLSHSSQPRLSESSKKSAMSHLKTASTPRKAVPQNGRIPAGAARKPSYHSQPAVTVSSPMSPHRPLPMSLPTPESASCYLPPGGLCSPTLHVDTALASRLSYDMAMRNLLTLSHMAMAQGGMLRPPPHMFPTHPMFPPRAKGHDFYQMPDPALLRQQSEAMMGAASKKASPTAGSTAPQLRTPTALTSASIQHMEDLTRTVGKRSDSARHTVTLTPIPFKG